MKNYILLLSAIFISCESIKLDNLINGPEQSGPPNLAPGEEWVQVPANAGGMGLPAFYVMKYEAKAMLNDESASSATGTDATPATHKPVSTADNQPWGNINANDAAAECESLGSAYHLISNPEWMAIARDLENQAANWTGGSVGSGCMFRGNSGEATTGDGTSITDSCGYNASTDPEAGSGRDQRAKHTLSNGSEIFDISGNLWEWVDWDKDTMGFQTAPDTSACAGGQLPSISCGAFINEDYNTSNGTYTATEGTGSLLLGAISGVAVRGGTYYTGGPNAGIFTLHLNSGINLTTTNTVFGFRCVYRP